MTWHWVVNGLLPGLIGGLVTSMIVVAVTFFERRWLESLTHSQTKAIKEITEQQTQELKSP